MILDLSVSVLLTRFSSGRCHSETNIMRYDVRFTINKYHKMLNTVQVLKHMPQLGRHTDETEKSTSHRGGNDPVFSSPAQNPGRTGLEQFIELTTPGELQACESGKARRGFSSLPENSDKVPCPLQPSSHAKRP